MATEHHVVLAVITKDPEDVIKIMEKFSAIVAGFVMDGMQAHISTHAYDESEEEQNDE